ncbi:MAG: 2OG-Fe(II) oxygenase [Panacagrimonas sp.]
MDRAHAPLDSLIAVRLREAQIAMARQFAESAPIRYCVLDGLLPEAVASAIHGAFPDAGQMRLRSTFRERKYVSAQMDRHDPLIEAALFAFHAEAVVEAIRDITGKRDLHPDPQLYAGGVSSMGCGHFLNPHIDNSHDAGRVRWRNLNLLFYLTPDWPESAGGDLELWPNGIRGEPVVIAARFNRLVVMETHQRSLHSVRPIAVDAVRCCVSNYYFGDTPMRDDQAFHVTSFRARPGQPLRDWVSRIDSAARMLVRKGFRKGLVDSRHRYER